MMSANLKPEWRTIRCQVQHSSLPPAASGRKKVESAVPAASSSSGAADGHLKGSEELRFLIRLEATEPHPSSFVAAAASGRQSATSSVSSDGKGQQQLLSVGYSLRVTDLKVLYMEDLNGQELVERCSRLNPAVEVAPTKEIVAHLERMLLGNRGPDPPHQPVGGRGVSNPQPSTSTTSSPSATAQAQHVVEPAAGPGSADSSFSASPTTASTTTTTAFTVNGALEDSGQVLRLVVTGTLLECPFRWEFHARKAGPEEFCETVFRPSMLCLGQALHIQKRLVALVQAKDQEIQDYVLNGGILSRKSLQTEPFSELNAVDGGEGGGAAADRSIRETALRAPSSRGWCLDPYVTLEGLEYARMASIVRSVDASLYTLTSEANFQLPCPEAIFNSARFATLSHKNGLGAAAVSTSEDSSATEGRRQHPPRPAPKGSSQPSKPQSPSLDCKDVATEEVGAAAEAAAAPPPPAAAESPQSSQGVVTRKSARSCSTTASAAAGSSSSAAAAAASAAANRNPANVMKRPKPMGSNGGGGGEGGPSAKTRATVKKLQKL